AMAQRVQPLMTRGGSILTMTYYGSEKVMPHYNVMGVAKAALESSVRYLASDLGPQGIRVNAISAGPIKTLAAAGIAGFRDMLHFSENASPLRHLVTIEDVGNAALWLASPLSSMVTGQTIYVDAGYNIMGVPSTILTMKHQVTSE
ncbi:MAG TPA: SDR family oxidoreductase, partial [Aggregatilineaceae bacterium]|nr:SDR family oxidoreductase [Aggregatilineaceae bacterium]